MTDKRSDWKLVKEWEAKGAAAWRFLASVGWIDTWVERPDGNCEAKIEHGSNWFEVVGRFADGYFLGLEIKQYARCAAHQPGLGCMV